MSDSIRTVLGIRYAEPVTGARRFGAPVPVAGIERVPGDGFGPAAWQPPHPDHPMGDDCLTLNIWAPASDRPLPVLVWIHGGGYIGGTARQPELDGAELAVACEAVVVAVQYRLGAWGFLDLRSEVEDAVANAGLLDVIAALDWVRRNIGGYGGDPERIAVDGASAGAGIVGALLAAPSAHGRFHAAIMQSPPLATVQSAREAAAEAARFVDLVGEDPRTAPPETLVEAQHRLALDVAQRRPGVLVCSPVVDGALLSASPERVLAAGRGAPVPVLGMWNTDEGTAFREDPVIRTDAAALERLTGRSADDLRADHPGWPDDASRAVVATDAYFSGPLRRALAGQARVAPTWLARFAHRTPALDALGVGATHSAEGPFLFGNLDAAAWAIVAPAGPSADDRRIMTEMRHIWRRFLHEGSAGWEPLEPRVDAPEHVIG